MRLQNAQVRLCRCKGHQDIDVHTDAAGVAHVIGLSQGKYSIEIKAAGFKSSRQNIKVQAHKTERLQVKLQLAPANVTVDVTATPVEVQGMVGIVTSVKETPFPLPTTGLGGRPSPLK